MPISFRKEIATETEGTNPFHATEIIPNDFCFQGV